MSRSAGIVAAHDDHLAAQRNAGQRLAPEPEARGPEQVVLRLDLRSGVGPPAEGKVAFVHARPVIHHAYARESSTFEVDIHGSRARIDRVVQELPHNGKRPVDDLAGRYL